MRRFLGLLALVFAGGCGPDGPVTLYSPKYDHVTVVINNRDCRIPIGTKVEPIDEVDDRVRVKILEGEHQGQVVRVFSGFLKNYQRK